MDWYVHGNDDPAVGAASIPEAFLILRKWVRELRGIELEIDEAHDTSVIEGREVVEMPQGLGVSRYRGIIYEIEPPPARSGTPDRFMILDKYTHDKCMQTKQTWARYDERVKAWAHRLRYSVEI